MKRIAFLALLATLPLAACGDKGDGYGNDLSKKSGGGGSASTQPQKTAGDPRGGAAAGGYGYTATLGADLDKKTGDALAKARKYLLSQRDAATGAWDATGATPAGFTAIATLALIGSMPRESVANDPTVQKSLQFVASKQGENGSVSSNPAFVNYETSAAVSAFAHARMKEFAAAQAKARDFLVGSQIQGDEKDPSFGGFPYKSKSNPDAPVDLSNAQFAATAAHDAEVKDAAFWTRLSTYLGHVQNRSETNTLVLKGKVDGKDVEVVSGNDGGAGYQPGGSKADFEVRPDGKVSPRSYGSMTYALLKCLLFSGVKADDPRVVAAVDWLKKNFVVDRNPGFESAKDPRKAGQQGYYYYVMTMARALAEYEKATGKTVAVVDASGHSHDWRRELAAHVVSLQQADGSWTNTVDRWEEGKPVIATSYAMQALAVCQGRLP